MKIDGVCREVLNATEFVAIVTNGEDGPHVVGNWGDYIRKIGVDGDTIVMPAGRYKRTEANLERDDRVKLLIASHGVMGTRSLGQGCEISGRGEIVTSGAVVDEVKAKFPWARGAFVVRVEDWKPHL